MEYQENLAVCLNLSRKELQGLCKKNNLPANGSTSQLAKSLSLFLKKKATCPVFMEGYSSGSMDVSSCTSGLPSSKPEETYILSGQTIRGPFEKRVNSSSESDSPKMPSINKENRIGDRLNLQIQNQLCTNVGMTHENADKHVHVCAYNNESTECFGCPVDRNVQHAKIVQQHGCWCHHSSVMNKSQSPSPRSCCRKLLGQTVTDTYNLCSSKRPRFLDSSKNDGLVSLNDISTKAAPSFEFYAMSDEGINLYIDLHSGPSDWIRSLKDDVCINEIAQHQSLGYVTSNSRDFSDVDKYMMALPSGTTGLSLQTEVDRNTVCTNSSLSSVVSQNCES